jgi:nitrogen regulatory protein P-II 1
MKKIEAIIKPFKLDEVKGRARQGGRDRHHDQPKRKDSVGRRGIRSSYRGAEYRVEFLPKVKVEILIDDAKVTAVVDAIIAARTGASATERSSSCPWTTRYASGPASAGPTRSDQGRVRVRIDGDSGSSDEMS